MSKVTSTKAVVTRKEDVQFIIQRTDKKRDCYYFF